jgi:hypothetical protein
MQRVRFGLLIGLLVAITLGTVACGGGSSGGSAEADAEWAWLTEAKQTLDSKRQELSDLRRQATEAEIAGEEAAESGAEEVEGEVISEAIDCEAEIAALEEEIAADTDAFTQRLVVFLNADPMIEGEPPTERQTAALRLKSSEDIILAQEWIDKGGDYKRAIDIYTTALGFDPDNEELRSALEAAELNRWMSEERFAAVEKGMGEAEVRSLLGQANLHNVRRYDDKDVVAWFYPTAEGGAAAAVWFRPDDSGALRVYQIKFQAVDPKKMAEAAEAEG